MDINCTCITCFSFLVTQHPSILPLASPVFSDLWSGDQAAGDNLCLSEPNQNRGGTLQSSATAAHTEGLSIPRMPQLESQQVEWGMFPFCTILHRLQSILSGTMKTQLLQQRHKRSQMLPRVYRCKTCSRQAPVQSLLSLFLFRTNV